MASIERNYKRDMKKKAEAAAALQILDSDESDEDDLCRCLARLDHYKGERTETDAVTDDDLEHPHVCFQTPDGSKVYCFNYETLRRIAVINGNGKWLQPPIFRNPMSPELLLQIETRFGKEKLKVTPADDSSSSGCDGGAPRGHLEAAASREFQRRLDSYRNDCLSKVGDLYVCPLCYLWLARRKYRHCREAQLLLERQSDERRRRDRGAKRGSGGTQARARQSGGSRASRSPSKQSSYGSPSAAVAAASSSSSSSSSSSRVPKSRSECARRAAEEAASISTIKDLDELGLDPITVVHSRLVFG